MKPVGTSETGAVYDWPRLLKALRDSQGWRQHDLSVVLKIRSNVTVSRWERGETIPDTRYSRAIEHLCRRSGLLILLQRYRTGSVRLRLPWFHHAQFAGFYAASLAGLYQQAALHVALDEGGFTSESSPLEAVANGSSDFGICRPWSLIKAVAQAPDKYRVKIVAVIFDRTPLCQIVLPSGTGYPWPITTFDQLLKAIAGHQVQLGRPEPSNRANLELQIALHSAASQLRDTHATTAAFPWSEHLIGGDGFADVVSAYRWVRANQGVEEIQRLEDRSPTLATFPSYVFNEPHLLAGSGLRNGHDFSVIPHHEELMKLGIPSCGDVLFASQRIIEQQPEAVRRFCQASLQGWELVKRETNRDIDVPLEWVHAFMGQTLRPFDREHQAYMLREICRNFVSGAKGRKKAEPAGRERWQAMISALEDSGAIKRGVLTPEVFVWDELLDSPRS